MSARINWIGYKTIVRKEITRILRIWGQTIVPPAITMSLYFIIFGELIGNRPFGLGLSGSSNGYLAKAVRQGATRCAQALTGRVKSDDVILRRPGFRSLARALYARVIPEGVQAPTGRVDRS